MKYKNKKSGYCLACPVCNRITFFEHKKNSNYAKKLLSSCCQNVKKVFVNDVYENKFFNVFAIKINDTRRFSQNVE